MNVRQRLASALGRSDERPNVELAEALVAAPDATAVAELAEMLAAGTVAEQNDAIKVLYELGERQPALIAPHVEAVAALLGSRNNRNVWGAMSALATLATIASTGVAAHLPAILAAADKGSVIAKDKAMSVLSQLALAGDKRAMPALLERLAAAAPNQFPMYAELALPAVDDAHRARFRSVLEVRLKSIEQPAKRARVEKVLKRLAADENALPG